MDKTATWALVVSPAGKRLGVIIEERENTGEVIMCPCYEYISFPQVTPQGQIAGYVHAACSYDGLLFDAPVRIRASEIMYFSSMHPMDREHMLNNIEAVEKHIKDIRRQRESGIVITSQLPGNGDDTCGSTRVRH